MTLFLNNFKFYAADFIVPDLVQLNMPLAVALNEIGII